MSREAPIAWDGVTADGYAKATVIIPPLERYDFHDVGMSFYYTGDGPGLIRFFRDLNSPGRRTWVLYTDMSGELSAEDSEKWVVRCFRKRRTP